MKHNKTKKENILLTPTPPSIPFQKKIQKELEG